MSYQHTVPANPYTYTHWAITDTVQEKSFQPYNPSTPDTLTAGMVLPPQVNPAHYAGLTPALSGHGSRVSTTSQHAIYDNSSSPAAGYALVAVSILFLLVGSYAVFFSAFVPLTGVWVRGSLCAGPSPVAVAADTYIRPSLCCCW